MALFYDIQFNEYEKSYLSFKMKSNNNSNDKFYSFEVIKPECDKNIIDKEILKEKYKKKMNELNKKRVVIR